MTRVEDEILRVLHAYLSIITAKAILSLSAVKAKVNLKQLDPSQYRRLMVELEKGVLLFVPGKTAQADCLRRLTALMGSSLPCPDKEPSQFTVPIENESDIVKARTMGRSLCQNLGFNLSVQVKVATVISELARNIVQYALPGVVEMTALPNDPVGIEVVAKDNGPGITNIETILKGEYRSRTGMGMGLIGTRRLMDEFHIQTSSKGTSIKVRKFLR